MRKLAVTLFLTAVSLALPFASVAADRYVCHVDVKRICGTKDCKEIEVLGDDYRIIDKISRTYLIGNDQFRLEEFKTSGVFEIFNFGGASFMKMSIIDEPLSGLKRGQFIEVRDTFLSVLNSYGICKF